MNPHTKSVLQPRHDAGQYQLVVGPEITDLAGNLMDQDGDGTGGELPADQFSASFTLESSVRLDFGKATTPVAAGYQQLVETDVYAASVGYGWQAATMSSFDRASDGDLLRDFHYAPQGTFLVDLPNGRYEVVLTMGDAGGLHDQMGVFLEGAQVDTVTTAAGQYAIRNYVVEVTDDQLTLDLIDQGGSNANIVINALEVIVAGPDEIGPKVVEVFPSDTAFGAIDRIRLQFDEAIDDDSLDANDLSLFGPAGVVEPLTVTRLDESTYEVGFALRHDAGQYQLVVGPEITDLAGNLMDQDGDGTGGELPADQFSASFTLESSLRLDFGKATTPVAAGYQQLVETDMYAASVGYGWQAATMSSFDRASDGDLLRDFHYAPQGTFLVDLPNGRYEVVLTMGDAGGLHDQMGVFLEGAQVDTVTTAAGQYAIRNYVVEVTDDQLTLDLIDQGGSNANIVINALDVIVAGPDETGPKVVEVFPSDTAFGAIDRIRLRFDEAIDDDSLDANDLSLFGPAGVVEPLTVTRLDESTYEVGFAPRHDAGQYQLVVGPEITDLAGNLMDQDGDGTGGELPADQFSASFTLESSLRLDFGKATTPVAAGYQQLVETDVYAASVGYGWQAATMNSFDRASDGDLLRDFHYASQGTFLVDLPNGRYEVVLTMGDAGGLHDQMGVFLEGAQVDTVTTAAGQYAVRSYFVEVTDGQLTLDLIDQGGSNANIVINALEVIVAGPDEIGPKVVEVFPSDTAFGAIDRIRLRFDEAIDDDSLDANDLSLFGPAGVVEPLTVTRLDESTYEVGFALRHDAGQYQLVAGPEITDLAGNLMDQDGDGTGGELPADQFSASFTLESSLRLDFGKATTPVVAGYQQLVETDVYAASVGYGWQAATMSSFDRASDGDLLRDFHYASQGTFLVDLPNGRYEVVLTMGDAGGLHDQMGVFLEGAQVDTVTTAAGQYATNVYLMDVVDGQLTLQLVDMGGVNTNVVINALEVTYQAGSAGAIVSSGSSLEPLPLSGVAASRFPGTAQYHELNGFLRETLGAPHTTEVVTPVQEPSVRQTFAGSEYSMRDTGGIANLRAQRHSRKQYFAELTSDHIQEMLRSEDWFDLLSARPDGP